MCSVLIRSQLNSVLYNNILQRSAFSLVRTDCTPRFLVNLQSKNDTFNDIKYFSTSPDESSLNKGKSDEDADNSLPNNEHFRLSKFEHPLGEPFTSKLKPASYWDNPVPHPIYSIEELDKVEKKHHNIRRPYDAAALLTVKALRFGFDVVSRYKGPGGAMTKNDWLNRCLFLETLAGVPGMVAGMARHLKSLRSMKRDHGWIHTLLSEAENERMHLLIFMKMKGPSAFFRAMVILGQGFFFNWFFITYIISPRTCHRFVGYLEEEAVKTYTCLLEDLDSKNGHLALWGNEAAPNIAVKYYKLPEGSTTVRDIVKCVRADEANHRDVNHTFAGLNPRADNPFIHSHGKVK